jgi:predicted alpha-1,6-mannanase (GH76 family)
MARSKQAYYMARIKQTLYGESKTSMFWTQTYYDESETSILSIYRREQNRNIRWREQTTQIP